MRTKRSILALAYSALFFILLFESDAAIAQRIVVAYPGLVSVYDTNGVVTNISDQFVNNPYGVATDSSGNIYVGNVANTTNGRVAKYGPDYHLITPALFHTPTNSPPGVLAVDQEGYIYVSSYEGLAVSKYDPDGYLVTNYVNGSKWGNAAVENGNSGVACGLNGNIYACGTTENFLFEYNGGQLIRVLNNPPTNNFDPYGVAADTAGNVYAFEWFGGEGNPSAVYKLSPNGSPVTTFSVSSFAAYGIAVDNSGNFYLGFDGFFGTPGEYGVEEYNASGNVVSTFPVPTGYGSFAVQTLPQLGVTTAGNQTLAYWTPVATNFVLQSVTNPVSTNWRSVTNGTPVAGVSVPENLPARFFRFPVSNLAGFVPSSFVSDYNYNFNGDGFSGIFEFNPTNHVAPEIYGDLNEPEGLAIDASDNLYVADQYTGAVWKYGPNNSLNVAAVTNLNNPFALAVDEAGNIYVTSASYFGSGSPVSKYDPSGYFIANIGYSDGALAVGYGTVYTSTNGNLDAFNFAGQLIASNTSVSPAGLAVDFRGSVYAIDGSGNVFKYDANLNPITGYSLNDANSAAAGYGWGGIAADAGGNLYVLRADDGVDEFDANGNLLNSISGPNYGNPQFIAAQSPALQVKFAAPGNQCVFYWTSAVPLTPQLSNYVVVLSVTNLVSSNWLAATDAAFGMGVIITNSPPGSVFRLQPTGQEYTNFP